MFNYLPPAFRFPFFEHQILSKNRTNVKNNARGNSIYDFSSDRVPVMQESRIMSASEVLMLNVRKIGAITRSEAITVRVL